MRSPHTIAVIVVLSALLIGCSDDTIVLPSYEGMIVQAYLYADAPVEDIRLTGTLPLDSDETTAPPVSDAVITLHRGAERFDLVPTDGEAGYYHYAGDDLLIAAGEAYTLSVIYNGETVTSTTVVPHAPQGMAMSADTLWISDEMKFPDPASMAAQGIEVTWDNLDGGLYVVVVDNLEEEPEEIITGRPSPPKRFFSQPVSRDSYPINPRTVTHYGRHRMSLYRVNQEYADLYATSTQDSRDLNEPLSNIEKGLGIFTAFNLVTAEFTVAAK